jgi:N-terminal domain of galactosyltransferase
LKARIVVPRLADSGERDRLWEYCRRHWGSELPALEIFEGHHEGDGPFNRSAAINRAAEGEWDFAVILDSDTIVDAEQVISGIELAEETGCLVLPYKLRNMLSEAGTQAILGGHVGSWEPWVTARERDRVSCCVIVPRALWDAVGGFDERFTGWGGEDEAFYAACAALGGVRRLDGANWHLHHVASPHHDRMSPLYRQALRLTQRYKQAAVNEFEMRRLLREPHTPDQVALIVLTTGGRDTLARTLASAEENLFGPIGRRLICVDGPRRNVEAVEDLDLDWTRWDTVQIRGGGYPKAVTGALEQAIGSGQPWIFWLEDDFTFNESVDLLAMQVLVEQHDLAQLSLMRQPWYEPEIEAGGVVAANPDAFTQRDGFVEHAAYWTMNPMLTRRSLLAEHRWPQGRRSELRFGHQVFADPRVRAGILGSIEDEPRVEHIGLERAGRGY